MNAQHIRNAAIALLAGTWLSAAPLYADMHGKGMMMDAEQQQKKMGEMRKQMDEMQKSAPTADTRKQHLHPRDGK